MKKVDVSLIPALNAGVERLYKERAREAEDTDRLLNPWNYMTLEELDFEARHCTSQIDTFILALKIHNMVTPEVWEEMRKNYSY